jgi:hypothetical protein
MSLYESVGLGALSSPVTIVVESPLLMTALKPNFKMLPLEFVGDSRALKVIGISSGYPLVLNGSAMISFATQNSTVATVNSARLVTAVGSGSTNIVATYQNPDGSSVTVSIPGTVPSLI